MQFLTSKYLACLFYILALDFSFLDTNQLFNIFDRNASHSQIDLFQL
jgi:hypothetical protein